MQTPSEIEVPKIDVKEGGKISGYGERFEVNLVSGSASFSVPVQTPKLRETAPELALAYSGTVQNSPFGLGLSLDVPFIGRLTDKGIPKYNASDRFVLGGSELTPRYDFAGDAWVKSERQDGEYTVIAFRSRIETTSDSIEWWQHAGDDGSFWKVIDSESVTTLYGVDETSRLFDPAHPRNIFKWMISERRDVLGNRILYSYKREDGVGLPSAVSSQLYIQSIRYGNYLNAIGAEHFAIEILFDYGEYDLPSLAPVRSWPVRKDSFSSYRPGFEVRTTRLCRNILTIHDFPDEPGVGRTLTDVLALNYDEDFVFSKLRSVQRIGWRKQKDGTFISEAKPAMRLAFGTFDAGAGRLETLNVSGLPPFPGLPGHGRYQFTDLYGDGIPGMLFNNAAGLAYWRALGEGFYQPPLPPTQFPLDTALSDGRCALMDVTGNGHQDLVVQIKQRAGYYRNNNDGSWESFVPFAGYPSELAAPGMQFADLDGNGRQDAMIAAGAQRIRVYNSLGAAGFDLPALRSVASAFPAAPAQGELEIVAFAGIFGDGLQHRVQLTDGMLIVWPSLGYGRFGAPVTLRNVPRFDAGLTAARIFFADVTGSGFADLIYAYPTHLAIHRNESGNGFSDALTIVIPPGIDDLDQVNWADVFGSGRSAFVLSKAAADIIHYALTFASEDTPYYLKTIDNGFGAVTTLHYRSSTHFQLADRKAGRPWPTSLSTVVQVVDSVIATDSTTGLTSIKRYQYADGYYDPVEREFRGFAYVQSQDSQGFAPEVWHFPAARLIDPSTDIPTEPGLTRRWNNTGAAALVEARSVPLPHFDGNPLVPADVLAPEILVAGGSTIREAYRALKEREAAKSLVGVGSDGIAKPVAYQTSAQNYDVKLLQPRIGANAAAFHVTQRQSRSLTQEDVAEDARISDAFNLATDAFGNITLSAAIAYPRKAIRADLPPQQLLLVASATERAFINHPQTSAEPYRYIGLQWQERALEIGGLDAGGRLLDFDTVARVYAQALAPANVIAYGASFTPGLEQARPYKWTRDLYWNASQTAPMPYGSLGETALFYEQHQAVFPQSFVSTIFGSRVDADMLGVSDGRGAGYTFADDYWWNTGTRRHYGSAAQFFVPVKAIDPYGAATDFGYDAYAFEIVSSTDALGQVTHINIDYQALQPRLVIDINGNSTETVYSPLAAMVAFSRFGTIGGQVVGDQPLDNYIYIAPTGRAEILDDPEKFLQGAGSYYFEDFLSVAKGQGPVNSILLDANRAVNPDDPKWDPAPRRCGITLAYVDSAMRALAKQNKIEANGLIGGEAGEAWIVTEQVTYDEQGRVVRRYQPFVSSGPDFVSHPEAPFSRDSYDALGRVIRSDKPPGFFSKTDYRTWERTVWDEDDTIKSSPYYLANIGNTDPSFANERNALLKAAVFDGTPTTFYVDPLGRDCLEQRIEVFSPVGGIAPDAAEIFETGIWRDINGAATQEVDPRFYAGAATTIFNQCRRYDMGGKTVSTLSTDRGKSHPGTERQLFDCLGNLLDRWDNRGLHTLQTYDLLRRPTGTFVSDDAGLDYQAEALVYGTDSAFNTRNRIVIRRDQAEEACIAAYNLTEQPTSETKRFPVAVGVAIDWRDPQKIVLLPDIWQLGAAYNRRGWPLAIFNADGSVETSVYYLNGWRQSNALAPNAIASPEAILVSRRYAVMGQPAESSFANNTRSERDYDPATQRLAAIRTTRQSDAIVLQDDRFYYDPVGNVTRIEHRAELPDYWGNGIAEPLNDYTYDSLYRLRIATGRQQADLAAANAIRLPASGAGTDPTRLVAYIESYTLDRSNNLTEIRHVADGGAGQGSWTKTFAVSSTSNHVVPAEMAVGGKTPDDFYDLNGNLSQLPNLPALAFDYRNQLTSATLVARDKSDDDAEFYAYAGGGGRRRKTRQTQQAGGIALFEDSLYIGNLVLTRRTRVSGGMPTPAGEASSLSVFAGSERLLVIDRGDNEPTPQARYQLANNQTSVTIELDSVGQLITYEEYLPYGGMALRKARSELDFPKKRYRFIGRELDQATGFYSIGLRSYIPWMGRWLTTDPAGTKDGLNLYAYAGANPTSYIDRTGLERTRLTGPANLVAQHQARMNTDFDRAHDMLDCAIELLQAQVASRSNWLVSTFWRSGTINPPDPLVSQYFGINGTSRTDANRLIELLDNFRAIKSYLARPPVQSRLSVRYLQSFFVNTPQFNIRQDTPATRGTIAYVQGASLNWPDWRILPPSVRSRPMGPLSGIGLLNYGIHAIRRFTPSDGINLYNQAHFGELNPNTRASTIVHEASHRVLDTDDHAYGDEPEFDTLTPTQQLYNADSYGLFAQAVYERDFHRV
jgi:RHS repeat-associated protein